MKNRLFCLFAFSFILFASQAQAKSISYTLVKNVFRFSTYFEMLAKQGYEGRIVKDTLHVRTTYDLYDALGEYEGQGICRAFSLGSIYNWAREIDLYDVKGCKFGFIDGKAFTTANAKFNFYDGSGILRAVAYLDYDANGFSIMEASRNEKIIGFLKRKPKEKSSSDDWEVILYDKTKLDPRILKIFSAFVSDCSSS